jgi:hypothetical protein
VPILIVFLLFQACNNTEPAKPEKQKEAILYLNDLVVRQQSAVITQFKSLYQGLYIQPIDILVTKYYALDSVILHAKDSLEIAGPSTGDSLLFAPAQRLFNYYDSACSSHVWNMILIMERFELEGFDDTHRIAPLADSMLLREAELLLDWNAGQKRVADQFELELVE